MSTLRANAWQNLDGTENFKTRAWINFNGTGTVAIRASGNVSSVTDNGVGSYTINFLVSMVDVNYSAIGACSNDGAVTNIPGSLSLNQGQTISAVTVQTRDSGSPNVDRSVVTLAVYR